MSKNNLESTNFLCGLKPIIELLERDSSHIDQIFIRKSNKASPQLLDLCKEKNVRFTLANDEALRRLYPQNNQGVVARLTTANFVELDELFSIAQKSPLKLILAFDQVQDVGNIGTLARTLFALGGAGIIITKHNGAYLGPVASKVARGALEQLSLCKVTNLTQCIEEAQMQGFNTIATIQSSKSISVFSPDLPTGPTVLVLGNEDSGIRSLIAKTCEYHTHIPMLRKFDSLNVAQAGAIVMAQLLKQEL